jgi:hypothetical protein
MRWFFKGKDGGPESNVTGYWLVECKALFSIVLLCFEKGSREAYHSHAFNAWSWVLWGLLREVSLTSSSAMQSGGALIQTEYLSPSFKPVYTARDRFHKVYGMADKTWVISFRGPWAQTWKEFFDKTRQYVTLTHGRKVVA